METYSLLEKLKESIKSDFQDLEERYNEAQNKIHCLEKENSGAKELIKWLQEENTSLKENLAKLQRELAYKDEKLKRKAEEQCTKDRWWNRYRLMSERRFKAMKDHGTFPPYILEKFVDKDMDEQMNDIPDNCSTLKENELNKKNRNLSTLKSKKKVRYNRMCNARSSAVENKGTDSHEAHLHICQASNKDEKLMVEGDENLFSDPNESTKLYQNCPKQHQDGKVSISDEVTVRPKILVPDTEDVPYSPHHRGAKVSVSDGVCVHPEILVPDTEDVYPEEVDNGLHCSIGAPSAASTPLAAANSPFFGYDNDEDDDNDNSLDNLEGAVDKSPCNDSVNLLTTAKTQLAHLPKSDSQLPVDLSYTQPQSPTIPSRTRSLQQDLNLTADCSVSLLPPHGMKNDEMEAKNEVKSGVKAINNNDDTVFISNEMREQQTHPKRDENASRMKKVTKQTTLDAKLFKVKSSEGERDVSVGKRKRESSDEVEGDGFEWPSESKHDQQADTVFKVPTAPPPKTPEVVLLEEFPSHVTGRKSCSTPLSSSGDMDQSADLFGNMDDQRSPDFHDEKEKGASTKNKGKENVSNKNCATKPGYKYVEVVRKRDERAKLNGYECRECQEYYQGLNLPEDELKKRLKHCSRHRAKFSPPPSTPPGFWNLSFPDTQEYMDKGYLKTESQAPAPKRLRRARRNKMIAK